VNRERTPPGVTLGEGAWESRSPPRRERERAPLGTTGAWLRARRGIVALLAISLLFLGVLARYGSLAAGSPEGFAPDEEITFYAVRGVIARGLPFLPSGVLYDRGIPYTYAAALGGLLFGASLETYRWVSLLLGGLCVALAALLAHRVGASPGLAACLLGTSIWLVLASQFARFYTAYVAALLATVIVFLVALRGRRGEIGFLVALGLARLLHETGAALLALPLMLVSAPADDPLLPPRSVRLRILAAAVSTLIAVQLGLYSVRVIAEPSGPQSVIQAASEELSPLLRLPSAAIAVRGDRLLPWAGLLVVATIVGELTGRRWGVPRGLRWPILLLAATLQLGLVLVVTAFTMLTRPFAPLRRWLLWTALMGFGSVATWTLLSLAQDRVDPSTGAVWSVLAAACRYPCSAVSYVLENWPMTSLVVVTACTLRPSQEVRWNRATVACALLGQLVVLGALRVDLEPRYLLGALTLALVLAAGLATSLIRCANAESGLQRAARLALAVTAIAVVAYEHSALAFFRLGQTGTGQAQVVAPISLLRAPVAEWKRRLEVRWKDAPSPHLLVCSDDLACHYLLGEVDYWWLATPREASAHGILRGGRWHSVYTGATILTGDAELVSLLRDAPRDATIAVVLPDTGKYDFLGRSDALARAIKLVDRPVAVESGRGLTVAWFGHGPSGASSGSLAQERLFRAPTAWCASP